MVDHPRLAQTVLDTTEPRTLAEFYRRLLGLSYRPSDGTPLGRGARRARLARPARRRWREHPRRPSPWTTKPSTGW
ncbi:VOC family protein [Embleya scabrispora]|uniref:VOC family protein n=1 Tax=Embleya scabrispora TaxID=159449 RepID=UPI00316ABF29